MSRYGWLVVIAWAHGLLACSSSTTNPADATGGSAGTGPTGSCDNGAQCVPVVPSGWKGPVELYQGQDGIEPEPCKDPYLTFEADFHAGPVGDPPDCTCDCTPTSTCSVTVTFDIGACTQQDSPLPVSVSSTDGCKPVDLQAVAYTAAAASDGTASGSCAPQELNKTVKPAGWTSIARLCRLSSSTACSGGSGICAPKPGPPYSPLVCIYQESATACPKDYPDQHPFFKDLDDQRACDCSCGSLEGAACDFGGQVVLSDDPLCGGNTASIDVASCQESGIYAIQQTVAMQLNASSSGGSCQITKGTKGAVSGKNPVTVCCR